MERTRYFDAGLRIDRAESSLKAVQKAGDAEKMQRIMDAHPELAMTKRQAEAQQAIRDLNKLAVTTIGDRKMLQQIDAARVARMKALNDALRSVEYATAAKPTIAQRLRGAGEKREAVAATP